MKRQGLVVLLGLLPWLLAGQEFSLAYSRGQILRHSPKFTFDPPPFSQGFEFSAQWQTTGREPWQHWLGFPAIGVQGTFYQLGDPDVFGHAMALHPYLNFQLWRRGRFQLRAGLGSGVAWLNRPFDRIQNPTNNAIGSRLNNITAFHGEALFEVHSNWRLVLGGNFTHFSNGATVKPNLGFNIPAWQLGLRYAPRSVNPDEFTRWPDRRPERRLGLYAQYQMGYKENTVPGGPRTPSYNASVAALIRLSRVNHLQVGLDWEYHRGLYDFGLHTFVFDTKEDARRGATRWGIFVTEELLFGDWGVLFQLGIYISPDSYLKPWFLYNRLGVRYYLPPIGKPATRFFGGIYLKSHKAAAEFVALGLGAAF